MNMNLLTEQQLLLPHQQNAWLKALRTDALEKFNFCGFPTQRDENWKYTNITPIANRQLKLNSDQKNSLTPEVINQWLLTDNYLVFVDGIYSKTLSQLENLPDKIIISNLSQQITENNLLLRQHLSHIARVQNNGFAALNTAFLADGAFIYLPQNLKLTQPLQLLFIATNPQSWIQPRNLIVLANHAQATVIETYVSTGNTITNAITEIILEEQAQLDYGKIQREHLEAYHVGHTYIKLAKYSHATAHSLSLGGALVRSDLDIYFSGSAASCSLHGLYVAQGRQHVDHHTLIEHAVPGCTSREFYRGILNDKGRAVFNGKVIVKPEAQQTNAEQGNHNLLLSSDAEIDTKPELEIYADDVKCTHGATVGQLDEEALFYLRTRGIPEITAKQLLINAFAKQVFDKITNVALREKWIGYLQEALCLV